jgi:hypothetical protein
VTTYFQWTNIKLTSYRKFNILAAKIIVSICQNAPFLYNSGEQFKIIQRIMHQCTIVHSVYNYLVSSLQHMNEITLQTLSLHMQFHKVYEENSPQAFQTFRRPYFARGEREKNGSLRNFTKWHSRLYRTIESKSKKIVNFCWVCTGSFNNLLKRIHHMHFSHWDKQSLLENGSLRNFPKWLLRLYRTKKGGR